MIGEEFSAISWQEQITFQWDDGDVYFVRDQHADLDFYCASSQKQQSSGRHFTCTHYPDSEPSSLCASSFCCIS